MSTYPKERGPKESTYSQDRLLDSRVSEAEDTPYPHPTEESDESSKQRPL